MRVTQSMVASNTLRNLNESYSNITKYQNQISSGKKVMTPSDDPVGTVSGMYYTSDLNSIDQYKKNVTTLQTWAQNSEGGMNQASSDLSRVQQLVVQGMNGTLSADDLKAVSAEVGQIQQDLANTANTQVAGKYIFHGTDVTNPPVTQNADGSYTVDTNTNNYNIEVSNGVSIRANVNQANTFNQNLFDVVGQIKSAFDNNDTSNLGNLLNSLTDLSNNISAERSDIGARSNRVDMASSWLDQQETAATQGLSDNIDVDIDKAMINLTTQQNTYQASLSIGARIIQPTLMDYLK